jgi:hypothetical protein
MDPVRASSKLRRAASRVINRSASSRESLCPSPIT